jgi:hypothetical protein
LGENILSKKLKVKRQRRFSPRLLEKHLPEDEENQAMDQISFSGSGSFDRKKYEDS